MIYKCFFLQARLVFLQWLPWALKMSRPGEKITRKSIMMDNKMKELGMKESSSKSLLANVLDMEDDYRSTSNLATNFLFSQNNVGDHDPNSRSDDHLELDIC